MAERQNKATVKDEDMANAFAQGFEEGMRQAATATMVYEFTATFEGTDLRRVQFSDMEQALSEARNLLINGHGVSITINAVAVLTQQVQEQRAVESPQAQEAEEDDVEDAEVVDEPPSPEKSS